VVAGNGMLESADPMKNPVFCAFFPRTFYTLARHRFMKNLVKLKKSHQMILNPNLDGWDLYDFRNFEEIQLKMT
jgi:hypothetical protein